MKDNQALDISYVQNLLAPSEAAVTLLPLTAIKESDHAFFWGAFFLSIATCLFGCAVSLFASAYSHIPFIVLVAAFGLLFLLFFVVFAVRGLHIRRTARALERLMRPRDIVYPKTSGEAGSRTNVSRIQESISRAFGDGAARSWEEAIGILSAMSADEVDVGTLHQVLRALVDVGMFTEKESNGKKMLTFNSEPTLA